MKTALQLLSRTMLLLACAALIGGVAYLLVGAGSTPSMHAGEIHGGHGESASLFGIVSVIQNLVEIGVGIGFVTLLTWLLGRGRSTTVPMLTQRTFRRV